ncbi:MAG: CDP-6-deoxy-delta-3,4-glucoseen reductase [Gammaproteobacteria bacterium]
MNKQATIQPSGHMFELAENEPILDSALHAGVALPYGCRGGSCGVCRAKLVTGEVHYPFGPPLALTDEELAENYVLPCLAEALSDVTLDSPELVGSGDVVVKTLPVRVARMEKLAHDVMGLWLKLPVVERLQFLAGQYIDFLLPGEVRRSFSIANAPHEDKFLELHIRQVPGGSFTNQVFTELAEKSLLRLQGPLGNFYLREESDRPIILMAGGTGFAPLKSIISHAIEIGIKRPMHVFWGVRAKRDLYHNVLAQSWAKEQANIFFTPVLSESQPGDNWQGETGWAHEAVLKHFPDLAIYDMYISGPPPMINAAKAAFEKAALPYDRLFFESFEFAADIQMQIDIAEEKARSKIR